MYKEVEVASLQEMQKDDFITLRFKKLIAAVLAEFSTCNYNCKLSEEDMQEFTSMHGKPDLSKKSNTQVLGNNCDDLRSTILYAHYQ